MLGATTDVATGASELFVAMAQMEPTTAATVGVVFQVAKWFVALWKSLDVSFSKDFFTSCLLRLLVVNNREFRHQLLTKRTP